MGVVGRLDQYASMLAYEFDDYSMSENLLTYSEQFNDASWAKNNYNVTANATTAPDGTLTADKLIAINASTFHDLYKSPGLGSNTYTLSIFAKAAEQSFIQLRIDDGVLTRVAMFNLTTGSVSSSSNVTSPTIAPYPNGWYRCSITVTSAIVNAVFNGFPTSSNATYSGDGTSGIYLWGAQLETGSVPTDYTPTTTTAISRVLPATTNTNITGLGTYYSSGFDENVGFTTFLSANVFAPYDLVYDDFGGTLFGAGQGRYMRQNTDKSVIVYNEIDEISDFRDIVKIGLVLDLDAGMNSSFNNTGTTWTDLSGNGNNGTLTNGPTYSSANGGSIVFDGTNDYVTMSGNNISGLSAETTDFSICIWVKYNSTASYGAFFAKQNSISLTPGTVRLDLGWVGNTLYLTTSNATSISEGNFSYPNNSSSWYQICLTCGVNSKVVYVNGTQTFSQNFTSFYPNNTYSLYIGGDRKLNGNIAQTQIYNRALSAAEVSQNYNALKHRFGL